MRIASWHRSGWRHLCTMRERLIRWLSLLGCGGLAGIVLAGLVTSFHWTLPLMVLGGVLLLAVVEFARSRRRRAAIREFRRIYGATGRDLLIVYTDSANWAPHIERRWIPRWQERAVVLNRSKPWKYEQPEARLWSALGGSLEHTPLAVVVPKTGRVRVIRFWRAFRDYKHGKPGRLMSAEKELASALG